MSTQRKAPAPKGLMLRERAPGVAMGDTTPAATPVPPTVPDTVPEMSL